MTLAYELGVMVRLFIDAAESGGSEMKEQERQGFEDGKAAGSWVFDGNTTQRTYADILQGIEDGDPMILDMLPSAPADSAEDYAYAFTAGVEYEVTRAARYQLEDSDEDA